MLAALARRARYGRVAVFQKALEPGSRHLFGTAASYHRAAIGSSHDNARLDNSTLHTGAVRPHPGFLESLFFTTPRASNRTRVFEMLPAFFAYRARALLRGWRIHIYSGPIGLLSGVKMRLARRAGQV
jgi:hypothetical protein